MFKRVCMMVVPGVHIWLSHYKVSLIETFLRLSFDFLDCQSGNCSTVNTSSATTLARRWPGGGLRRKEKRWDVFLFLLSLVSIKGALFKTENSHPLWGVTEVCSGSGFSQTETGKGREMWFIWKGKERFCSRESCILTCTLSIQTPDNK